MGWKGRDKREGLAWQTVRDSTRLDELRQPRDLHRENDFARPSDPRPLVARKGNAELQVHIFCAAAIATRCSLVSDERRCPWDRELWERLDREGGEPPPFRHRAGWVLGTDARFAQRAGRGRKGE